MSSASLKDILIRFAKMNIAGRNEKIDELGKIELYESGMHLIPATSLLTTTTFKLYWP